jgi:MFS family permease
MVVLDSNMVTLALPALRDELGFSRASLGWVIGAYSLAFGGTLLVAGRAGDLFGRRCLFTHGTLLFSAAALASACAPSPEALLAARAVEGLGAALALPASLALLAGEEGHARTRALGVYGAAISAAFVIGVALGGALTALAGWRAVFVMTVPLGIAAAVGARVLIVPDRASGRLGALELPGAAAATAAALTLLWALGSGSPPALGVGLLLAGAATAFERTSACPLVPPALLNERAVRAACIAALLTVATGVGMMVLLSLYLQEALGYGAAAAGLALSALGVSGMLAGTMVPRIAREIGLPRTLVGALVVQAAGVAILIPIGGAWTLALVLVGTAVIGAGHFGATVAFTALATGVARTDQRGVVLGMVGSCQQLGAALGLALFGTDQLRRGLATAAGLSGLAALIVLALSRETARQRRHAWRTRHRRASSSRRAAARERGSGSHAR